MKNRPPLIPLTSLTALFTAGLTAAALLLCGNSAQAQPTISGTYPNGTNLFQPSAQLSFTASSPATITNVSVSLKTTSIATGSSFFQTLTPGSGLTVTGPNTSETVTATLKSNKVYSATITITDGNGVSTNSTVNFDTVSPSYTWEAEDWDYTSGTSGLFHDNPQVNAYAGALSTSGVDFVYANGTAGPSAYRPQGVSTEGAGDVPRLAYIGTTNVDYDIGFGHNGTWCNYTRHYPSGTYNIYMRGADGNGTDADSAHVLVQSGTASIAGTAPFNFSVPQAGWQTYFFVPAIGADGKLAQITFDGTQSTVQIFEDGGDMNANFYMLVPADTNVPVIATTITNIYPDGLFQFQPTNNLTFTANSSNGIDPTGITVIVNGTNLLGQGYTSNLTSANGLVITGTSTNRNVSMALVSNTMYTVFIQVIDGSGNPVSTSVTFDTISPAYTFETEDWDYSGGLYYDNPQNTGANAISPAFPAANAYYLFDSIPEEDFHLVGGTNGYNTYQYRGTYNPPTYTALNTEGAGDKRRTQFTNSLPGADWDNGFTHSGDWGNYTRHYPAGVWNIYLRAADGGGTGGRGSIAVVTNGYQTTNQQTAFVGQFAPVPGTGNWQRYTWVPLIDSSGNLIKFDPSQYHTNSDGSLTLRYASGGGYNANFIMLVPADTTIPVVANLYPDGLVQFQHTNTLSFAASSSLGIPTTNISLKLNSVDVSSSLVITGPSTNRQVSYSQLAGDTIYSAVITVKNSAGIVYSLPYSFNTFNPNYYQWESVDWNYTSNGVPGQYIENQLNAYANRSTTQGIDVGQVNANTLNNPFIYRPYDGTNLTPSQEPAATTPRPQFVAAGMIDYKADYVEFGTWMDYTRHYPAGSYYVYGTFTEGGALTSATLSQVTSSPTTSNQTTVQLGTFILPVVGWGTFEYVKLTDASNNPVVVTFTGTNATTLQFEGDPISNDGNTCNTGFFMLVPAAPASVTLAATLGGGNVNISFPTQSGHSYQVQWTGSLSSPSWNNADLVVGDGSTKTVSYATAAASSRFYRVQIQ